MTQKKPDYVVYDEETQTYDAYLKPYATNISAPAITTVDTVAWKNANIQKVNKQVQAKYKEIKAAYDSLMKTYEYNELIYNSKFSFEPIAGTIYHLYKNQNEEVFLSIIAPNECTFQYVGSFKLNSDKIWEKIDFE